jgi:hypothetical protein
MNNPGEEIVHGEIIGDIWEQLDWDGIELMRNDKWFLQGDIIKFGYLVNNGLIENNSETNGMFII